MTIHEQAKAARDLANELFKGPCDRAIDFGRYGTGNNDPCLEKERCRQVSKKTGSGWR